MSRSYLTTSRTHLLRKRQKRIWLLATMVALLLLSTALYLLHTI